MNINIIIKNIFIYNYYNNNKKMKCNRRFFTEQTLKNKIIFNSSSINSIKWGERKSINNSDRKCLAETIKGRNIFSSNNKRLKELVSMEKEKIETIETNEEDQKKKEELSKKREISLRARKKIILRMRQDEKDNELKKDKSEENGKNEKNIKKRLKKIEIKYLSDRLKIKKLNNIEINNINISKNKYENIEKNKNNIENKKEKEINNIKDKVNTDINSKSQKFNFVLNRNIRNLYKKNLIKDISVLTEKSCKILKIEKFYIKNNENNDKINQKDDKYNKNTNDINIKSNNIYSFHNINYYKKNEKSNKESKENRNKKNNDNEVKIINSNRKAQTRHALLKMFENKRNNNYFLDIKNNTFNTANDYKFSFASSVKNLSTINSIIFKNNKDNIYSDNTERNNIKQNDINNKEINEYNTKKIRRKKNGNSEGKSLNKFSFFGYFKSQKTLDQNEVKKGNESKVESYDKNQTYKIARYSSVKNDKKKSNSNMLNLRTLSNNYFSLISENNKYKSITNKNTEGNEVENEDNNNIFNKKIFIKNFFEELIDINNSIDNRSFLKTLVNNFNNKYYIYNDNYNNDECNKFFKENENFEYIFKHFGLILVCLIFLAKDDTVFKEYNIKAQDFLIQLIYSSLNYIEMDGHKESNKIYNFINKNSIQTAIPIHRYVLSLIYLLFENKKEYSPLKNCLEQLHGAILKRDYIYLIKVINDSILYCYNSSPKYIFSFPFFKSKNNNLSIKDNSDKQNNDMNNNINLNNENFPSAPFIKSFMKKKYCLVLDIDETISHSLKLSFGLYFLLRPGTKEFLEEISKYYEIIIFTSSPKPYADKILDRIDINGNLISHRLYRNHVLYENGKSVKKLNLIGRDLKKTIFIDNLKSNAKYNLNNLCPITSWISDIFDNRLIKLKDKLIYIATSGKYDNDITEGL